MPRKIFQKLAKKFNFYIKKPHEAVRFFVFFSSIKDGGGVYYLKML